MERSEIRHNDDIMTPDGLGVVFGFGVDGRVMVSLETPIVRDGHRIKTPWYTCAQLSKPVTAERKVKHGAVSG